MNNLESLQEDFSKWVESNSLPISNVNFPNFTIEGVGSFTIIQEKYPLMPSSEDEEHSYATETSGILFDEDFHLLVTKEEEDFKAQFYCFNFGGQFFYISSESTTNFKLKVFKYLGTFEEEINWWEYSSLSIHGKYELLRGFIDYKEAVKKANFLKLKALGICEKNTLAGLLQFQQACEGKIKPIFGEQISIKVNPKSTILYDCKIYVISEEGYRNLLLINKEINTKEADVNGIIEQFILKDKLLTLGNGLVFIFGNDYPLSVKEIQEYESKFEAIFYEVDTTIFLGKDSDEKYLKNTQRWLKEFRSHLKGILLNDVYYLDKEQAEIQKSLFKVSGAGYSPSTEDKYLKTLTDNYSTWIDLFKDKDNDLGIEVFEELIESQNLLVDSSNFKIELGRFYLPDFGRSHLENKYKSQETNKELFLLLIQEGLESKGLNYEEFKERIEEELNVIEKGGFIDYFLILWDMIRWCKEREILTGIGRGSAAGSFISYLLDITKINPFDYDLLFSRFLNEGRIPQKYIEVTLQNGERKKYLKSEPLPIDENGFCEGFKVVSQEEILFGGSPADVDTDFPSEKRNDVKRYVESLYGENYVCSVATYTTFKIKQALKDLGKLKGLNYEKLNYLTTSIHFKENKDGDFEEIFKLAQKTPDLKKLILTQNNLINQLYYLLKVPKAASIHPCATIVLPDDGKGDIFSRVPVKLVDGVLVSEWEGPQLEAAGFLKEDILGILQLDKFENIVRLIKESGVNIDIYSLPREDKRVMQFFQEGWTGDVFQFGSDGLTSYCRMVKPDTMIDLINMVALFRPGVISTGGHYNYINLKHGKKQPEYDFGLKEVTKETFGIIVYQEQVMKACQIIGGFSEVETDDIRRCLHKDTLFFIEGEGYKSIKNIPKKTKIHTHSYFESKFNIANRIFKSGKKECIEIFTNSGFISVTKDHKIFTNFGWIEAKDLTPNHYVLRDKKEKYGNLDIEKNKLYLLSALITEGSLGIKGACHFTNKDKEELIKFKELIIDLNKYKNTQKNGDCLDIYFDNSLVEELDLNFVKSEFKELPNWCLQMNEECTKFLLGSLIDFDGSIYNSNRNNYINYCTKSPKLINQVSLLLSNIGVSGQISQDSDKIYNLFINYDYGKCYKQLFNYSKKINKSLYIDTFGGGIIPYNLWSPILKSLIKESGFYEHELIGNVGINSLGENYEISAETLNKYLKQCGRSKILESYLNNEIFWSKIKSIKDIGVEEVWDFNMSSEISPQAFANGILVHNSMGKKKESVIRPYKEKFIKGAIDKGCKEEEAESIWKKLEVFSGYGFNKSHAACYALMGYISQYLKVYYPLQFWTTALQFADKDEILRYVAEMNTASPEISIVPPDINKSDLNFKVDLQSKKIYWSLNRVKYLGEVGIETIIKEREEKGKFYSLSEFLDRVPKAKVNKRVVTNLILSGAFDEVENIENVMQRKSLLVNYHTQCNIKLTEGDDLLLNPLNMKEWFYILKQKELSGLGIFNFKSIAFKYPEFSSKKRYINEFDLQKEEYINEEGYFGGIVKQIDYRTSKNGPWACLTIDINNIITTLSIWNQQFEVLKEKIKETKDNIILFEGVIKEYRGTNSIHLKENSKFLIIK